MSTRSRIQSLANNWEIENSRNKSHAKISELTVLCLANRDTGRLKRVQCLVTAWLLMSWKFFGVQTTFNRLFPTKQSVVQIWTRGQLFKINDVVS